MSISMKNLDRICFLTVVLVTIIGGYLVGSSWIKNQKISVQESELISKRSVELIQMEKDLLRLRRALDISRERLNGINKRIPESADIGSFIQELDKVIKKNQIKLTSIRPLPSLKGEYLVRIPINLVCKGSFGRIFELLRDLEGMERVVLVEKMMISRPEVTQECGLELTMNILEYDKKIKAPKGA